MKKNNPCSHRPPRWLKKMLRVFNIWSILLFCSLSVVYAKSYSQTEKISLNVTGESLLKVLDLIQHQSGRYTLLFSGSDVEHVNGISLRVKDRDIVDVLTECLKGTGLTFDVQQNLIVLKKQLPQDQEKVTIRGTVKFTDGSPLPGVTIRIKGTDMGGSSDANGNFVLPAPKMKDMVLLFSFVGMQTQEILYTGQKIDVVMKEEASKMEEVVVTGIFVRKAESFTGAAKTISSQELSRVGNQNLFQSLKNLDPSLNFIDNLDLGSNPNAMPDIQLRGTTSFPAEEVGVALKGNYQSKPNQPLFILDGFESTVERIFDLDMNRVESVTILKDAAAKALYGSKAANGVVVVETKRLAGDQQRVTYTGSVNIEAPDLSSYNLCSAAEKLEAERIDGVYTTTFPDQQIELWNLYNTRRQLILEGLDTYWLSKPLRTGVGQKHSLSVEIGDSRNLRSVLDFSYNRINGVMKGSFRNNISGNANVSYRMKNFLFRNIMSIVSMKSEESPYGYFSEYTRLNPYWRAVDPETGNIARWAELNNYIPNPMYDALIGTFIGETYLDFTNNFYTEWQFNDHLKVTGRIGISSKRSDSDEFLPADHSIFSTSTYVGGSDETRLKRGSYTLENGKSNKISADVNLNYSRDFGNHSIFTNLGVFVAESNSKAYRHKAEGFPANMGADITFARRYAEDSRPVGITGLNRELSFLGNASYSYANRYLLELTYRTNASSLYGKNNRWSPGWSAGVGWNIHHESFLSGNDLIKQLKLRASVGVTGNQNFNTSEAIATYRYYTDYLYQNMVGAYLAGLANPELKWEQRKDYNVGLDLQIGGLTASIEWYKGVTSNTLADISVSPSTGFDLVKDNLGVVSNTGIEVTLGYTIFQNRNGFLTLFGSATTEKNKLERVSESMRTYNETREKMAADQGNPKPVLIYKDGQSMNAIWAVPSLGIDPMTGKEIYVKRDGSLTYTYDPLDLAAVGDAMPKYRGNAGFTAQYKGIGASVTCRYLGGGDMYNQTLVDRVENVDMTYNVDRRVLLGRWQTPGQQVQFKKLGSFQYDGNPVAYQEKTRATSRFVQKRNEFDLAAINVYYDFPASMLRNSVIERLKLSFYMNDVAKWSSIKIERGLSYPYAHTMSFSLTATF